MLLGLNQNIRYRGKLYHIQTEDGGRKNPVITTLVFRDGTIVASRKTSYADILKFERLEEVVRELMREQHLSLIKALLNGELDDKLGVRRADRAEHKHRPAFHKEESIDDIILEHLSLDDK